MKVERRDLLQKIADMKNSGFNYLLKITAVDYAKYVEVIYMLRNLDKNLDERVSVELDPSDLWVDTIIGQYPAADWYERELSEMFGIKINGRNANRLLLEKWDHDDFPLRKNFHWNSIK